MVEPAHEWLKAYSWVRWTGPLSMGLILLSGAHMMHTVWGAVAWIIIVLAAMVLVAGLAVLNGRRLAAIGRAAATESEALSPAFQQRLQDPVLWTSIQSRVAMALGIIFLMTVKPDLSGSLLTIGIAAVLGLASAGPVWFRGQPTYRESRNEI
jgi:hypothetical protein